jgi:hypothetical protein
VTASLAVEASDTTNGVIAGSTRHYVALYGAKKLAKTKLAGPDHSY